MIRPERAEPIGAREATSSHREAGYMCAADRPSPQASDLQGGGEPYMTIPGIGALSASALVAKLGDGGEFRDGREAAAYLGLVPRQYSTGGKPKLGGISKRGDRALRGLLILGAKAVLRVSDQREDALGAWLRGLRERHHDNVAAVALANKNVRIAWALLRRGGTYREEACMT